MNILSIKKSIPYIATGLIALSSCSKTINNTEKYFSNKPVTEYQEFIASDNIPYIQSKLDSAVYRDLFNTTQYSKDSSTVADFNKLASSLRGYGPKIYDQISIEDRIRESLKTANISTKDYKQFEWGIKNLSFNSAAIMQHLADVWGYGNFFEKLGLMKNKKFVQKYEDISIKYIP